MNPGSIQHEEALMSWQSVRALRSGVVQLDNKTNVSQRNLLKIDSIPFLIGGQLQY